MAFLLITHLKEKSDDHGLYINKEYKSHLDIHFHHFTIGENTNLYIYDIGSRLEDHYKKSEKGRDFYFGIPIFKPNCYSAKPLAGTYALIRENSNGQKPLISITSDSLGFYPVYYMFTKEMMFVSDRQEFIAAICNQELALDELAIKEFCIAELINGNSSFYMKIKRLGINEQIHVETNSFSISQRENNLNVPVSKDEITKHYAEVFSAAKEEYDTLGFKLSGGYDSRLCLSLFLTHFNNENIHTITHNTTTFDMETAKKIATDYGIKQYFINDEQSRTNYYQKYNGYKYLNLTGMCGEMCRSFYYKYSTDPNNIGSFIAQYLPISKTLLLNKETKKQLKISVLEEIQKIREQSNQQLPVFRAFDWIYLNRARSMFSYQMTDPRNNLFPLLVNEFWFRFRLSFDFEEIQNHKPYHVLFTMLDKKILSYPFIHYSLFKNKRRLLEVSKLLQMQVRSKIKPTRVHTHEKLNVLSKDLARIVNTYSSLDVNYKQVVSIIDFPQTFKAKQP